MPKARVLTRSMAKPSGTSKSGTGHESTNSNDSTAALPGRPRTAGGDRGILRRLRLGRIFGFSHGIEANTASSPSDGAGADAGMAFKAQGIFRTNSVQTPTTENDLLAGAAQLPPPLLPAGMFPHASVDRDRDQMPQTLNTAQYMQNGDPADARKSRYSILSRRSSAPDVTDIARRLSRYSVSTRLEPATRADALLRAPLDGSYAADITESPLDSLNDSQEYTMAASYSELEHPSDDEYLVDLLPAKPVNSADTACSKRETADFPNGLNSTCASGPDALTETTQAALRSAAMQHPPLPPASANSASNSAGSAQLISPRSSSSAKVGVTASSAQCSHDSSPPKDTAPLLLESLGVQGCRSMQNGRGISSMRSTGSNARESPTTHRSPPPRTDTATTKLSDSAVLSAATDFGASIRPKAVRSSGSHGHANTTGGGVDRSRSNASLAPQTGADAPGTSGKLNSTCIGATNSGPELPPLPPKNAHAGQASPFMAVACDLVAPVGASTMLMGSVKARGEKKHMLQSLGAQAALSKPLPPPPQEQQRQSQPPTPTSAGLLPMPLLSPASSPPLPPLPGEQQCALPLRRHRHSSPTSDVNALREPLTEAGQQPAARTQPTAERVGLLGKRGQSSLPVHARPKSLYERSARREPLVSATEPPPLEARPSSSISAAKAFLTMMSSGRDYSAMNASLGTSELTIATKCSQRHFSCSPSGGSSPLLMPSSAPPASIRADHRSSGLRDPGTNERLAGAAANRSGCEGGVESSEKDNEGASSTGIIGNRSLRTRSKFATVGIRRASTYVWSRSSVFMRALSSTDELSNYQQQSHSSWEVADVELTSAKAADTAETQSVGRVNSSASDQIEPAAGDILPIPATQPTTRKSPAAMRLHAARELVITEKNFVDNMFVIKKVCMLLCCISTA
ncbi:hypothetical protein GQ54DRAFT_84774 [Martensiomyces pterosporus]|nr:hypothetical protein GQ54DRAFT_84774 [Martensiomyces pterosporus]